MRFAGGQVPSALPHPQMNIPVFHIVVVTLLALQFIHFLGAGARTFSLQAANGAVALALVVASISLDALSHPDCRATGRRFIVVESALQCSWRGLRRCLGRRSLFA